MALIFGQNALSKSTASVAIVYRPHHLALTTCQDSSNALLYRE